ncbi:MAG TPA: flagellar hook-length control protein FliK [Candidatus Cybelea sp.]|nr:flagellar hook-length control protein FliK [Candidatus Cybelea sp.]
MDVNAIVANATKARASLPISDSASAAFVSFLTSNASDGAANDGNAPCHATHQAAASSPAGPAGAASSSPAPAGPGSASPASSGPESASTTDQTSAAAAQPSPGTPDGKCDARNAASDGSASSENHGKEVNDASSTAQNCVQPVAASANDQTPPAIVAIAPVITSSIVVNAEPAQGGVVDPATGSQPTDMDPASLLLALLQQAVQIAQPSAEPAVTTTAPAATPAGGASDQAGTPGIAGTPAIELAAQNGDAPAQVVQAATTASADASGPAATMPQATPTPDQTFSLGSKAIATQALEKLFGGAQVSVVAGTTPTQPLLSASLLAATAATTDSGLAAGATDAGQTLTQIESTPSDSPAPPAAIAATQSAPPAESGTPGQPSGDSQPATVVPLAGAIGSALPASPAQAAAPANPLAVPGPAEQVAVHLAKAVQEGVDRIRIELEPNGLGKVEVKMDVGHDGRVLAVIAADSRQTLDMLQRDAGSLQRALQDAGLNADNQSLSFSLRNEGRNPGQNGHAFGDSSAALKDNTGNSGSEHAKTTGKSFARATFRGADGGLDIRV